MRVRATVRRAALATVVAVFATGCTDCGDDSSERTGELGRATYTYSCVDLGDPACDEYGYATEFPTLFGEGATFAVSVDDGEVEPASTRIVRPTHDRLVARRVGTVALLARRPSTGWIVDFLHVQVVALGGVEVAVAEEYGGAAKTLTPGEDLQLVATPLGALPSGDDAGLPEGAKRDWPLSGAYAFEWSTSDASVATIEASTSAGATLRAFAPGKVVVTAKVGKVSGTIAFTVEAGPVAPPVTADDAGADPGSGARDE